MLIAQAYIMFSEGQKSHHGGAGMSHDVNHSTILPKQQHDGLNNVLKVIVVINWCFRI